MPVVFLVLSACSTLEEKQKLQLSRMEGELDRVRKMPKVERAKYLQDMMNVILADDGQAPSERSRLIDLTITTLCRSGNGLGRGIKDKYAAQLTQLAPEDRSRMSEETFSLICETLQRE